MNNKDENSMPDYGVTIADMEMLRQRHFEAAEFRQLEYEVAFSTAYLLGAALKRLDGGS